MSGTKGKIVITFTRDAVADEQIAFDRNNASAVSDITMTTTFVGRTRIQNGEIEITSPTGTPGEAEAIGYVKYFDIDHNAARLMSISRVLNEVTIDINLDSEFEDFITDVGATEVITASIAPTFTLTLATLEIHPTDPCDFVDVKVTTSTQADSYALGNSITPVSTLTFTVSIPRAVPLQLLAIKAGKDSINIYREQWGTDEKFSKFYFNKLYDENVSIAIIPNIFSGATVSILVNYNNQLSARPDVDTLTYSLNGIDYFASWIFSGQADGDYTAYIKDTFGCIYTKDFTVSASGARDPFFFISNVNSITFSKNEVWDGLQDGIHKNEENVLSLSETNLRLFEEKLIFTDKDLVTIQFKSNYDTHNVALEGCDGAELSAVISVEKKSNNLDLYEGLDSTLYNFGFQKAGIYFTSGNVYNIADTVIGTYELNGNLPDSAIIGNYVEIDGYGVHQVKELLYDSEVDKKVLVFDFAYSGSPISVVYKTHYDLLPFEVYEFDVDFDDVLIHGSNPPDVRVRIEVLDTLYDNMDFYSEYTYMIRTKQGIDYNDDVGGLEKYVVIDYWNNNNRDIFYLYGIRHFIRAEVIKTHSIIDDDTEIIKGDASTYMAESTLHHGIEIFFSEVTHRAMLKIVLALSSENLFINKLGYIKKDNVSVKPVENTNLYNIEAQLLRTSRNFNTTTEDDTGLSEGYKTVFMARILSGDTGLIKI